MNSKNSSQTILVIGDLMLDTYHYCTTTRKAPEVDLPIYKIHDTKHVLGGASNVANNLANIFQEKDYDIVLVSLIGNDEAGSTIKTMLSNTNIITKLYCAPQHTTTQKVRLIHENKIVGRHDFESSEKLSYELETTIYNYVTSLPNVSCIVFSDYAKGVLTQQLCAGLIAYANRQHIPTFVDPKPFQANKYANCFCLKPNLQEAIQISGITELCPELFTNLTDNLKCQHLVVTFDKQGMYLDNINQHIQNDYQETEVANVVGCGDVVLAILVYIYITTLDIHRACRIANYVATTKTIRSIGNYHISNEDIQEAIEWEQQIHGKLTTLSSLSSSSSQTIHEKVVYDHEVDKLQVISNMPDIVFTNGCFDIVHPAHLKIIKYAKSLGKTLVLGLNSDSSIKQLKGESRPIHNEAERIEFLSELDWIDYIVVFYDTTPYNILKTIRPKIMVKGGDYNIDQVIGNEFVDRVVLFDYIENYSTTKTIQRSKGV
jgi:D-beta-D-heptose 7-phosphate kinase / D-beta-D-heptose 1-phosphate adenosyltransferase